MEEKMFRNALQFKLSKCFSLDWAWKHDEVRGDHECYILMFILMEEVSTSCRLTPEMNKLKESSPTFKGGFQSSFNWICCKIMKRYLLSYILLLS
jgi:hypothetical protein